ncbi:MAG: hypothetical protein VKJ64_15995 [Leptolyngbyaceae bacterium]|nr:hypothetical protein [Leptolyngbyaceae bacterium]
MNWIILIAALVISFLIFTWLIRVVKATVTTAFTIALLVLLLQLFFGIGPQDIWQEVTTLWQQMTQQGTTP